jgi:hypothetical protein
VETSQVDDKGNTAHLLRVDQVYTLFEFGYIDTPPGTVGALPVTTLLDQVVRQLLAPSSGTITSAKDITLSGHPGRDFIASGGVDIIAGRVYVVGDRIYVLETLTYTKYYPDEASRVQAYLDSFKFTSP